MFTRLPCIRFHWFLLRRSLNISKYSGLASSCYFEFACGCTCTRYMFGCVRLVQSAVGPIDLTWSLSDSLLLETARLMFNLLYGCVGYRIILSMLCVPLCKTACSELKYNPQSVTKSVNTSPRVFVRRLSFMWLCIGLTIIIICYFIILHICTVFDVASITVRKATNCCKLRLFVIVSLPKWISLCCLPAFALHVVFLQKLTSQCAYCWGAFGIRAKCSDLVS